MPPTKHVFIICGEASGELNAVNLINAFKTLDPQIKFSGVGSLRMRQAGADVFFDIKDLSAFGLFDVISKLPKFFALRNLILKKINHDKPDAIILIDFSGFNLRLAKAINKKIPVIYYISPQVWASRQGRIQAIKKFVSKLIVIFDFEQKFYAKHGLDANFVGHPLLDIVKPSQDKESFLSKLGLSASKKTIALLPGSRNSEVNNIFPIMLKSAELITKQISEVQFIVAKSPNVNYKIYKKYSDQTKINLKFIEDQTYNCLEAADFCLVASGTATLETAIMQKPFVVIYKMGLLNYLLYRPQVKLNFIGMVNIVAGKLIIPEFIQFNASPRKISSLVIDTLEDPQKIQRIKKSLAQVKSLLGSSGAGLRAAKIIGDFLKTNQ